MGKYLKRYIAVDGMPKAKVEKLVHYCDRDPHKFVQYDAFIHPDSLDVLFEPDEDRDSFCKVNTIELMTGVSTVRILIKRRTSKTIAIRLLRKIIDLIEKESEIIEMADDITGNTNLEDLEDDDMPF